MKQIQSYEKRVYVGHNGEEFLTEEAARESFVKAAKAETIKWLYNELHDAAYEGSHETNINKVVEWLFDNFHRIQARLGDHGSSAFELQDNSTIEFRQPDNIDTAADDINTVEYYKIHSGQPWESGELWEYNVNRVGEIVSKRLLNKKENV